MPSRVPPERAGLLLTALVLGATVLLVPGHRAVAAPDATSPAPVRMRLAAAAPAALPVNQPTPGVLVEQRLSKSGKRTVALTFDDGPDPTWTPQVLALLKRYHAVATFCMIGDSVQRNPDLVKKVVKAGMRLCDHSSTHPLSVAALGPTQQRTEILGARETLAEVTSAKVRYFRAPGGNWSPAMVRIAATKKMVPLGWAVDPRDWSRPGVAAIVSTVQSGVHPGAIVLMHDGGGDRQQTIDALGTVLPWLVDQGYKFGFPTS